MKFKLERVYCHSKGNCWNWFRIRKSIYYSGNQIQITWGRVAFVFEKKEWVYYE